tara:strand:+ start:2117 stop:2683 length:567 start_codon:yes stop_codon:yes gene_type:complete
MSQIFLKDLPEMDYSEFDPDNDIILYQESLSLTNLNPSTFRTNSVQIDQLTSDTQGSIIFLNAPQVFFSEDAGGKKLHPAQRSVDNLSTVYGVPKSAKMILLHIVDDYQGGGTRNRALHLVFYQNNPPSVEGRQDYFRSYSSRSSKDGESQPIMNTDQIWVPIANDQFTFHPATLENARVNISIIAYS